MLARLDALVAREDGENRSDVVRRALALYLKAGVQR
jgi:metal-responsive CopG/Arc/MetJ family transcriptional regulator